MNLNFDKTLRKIMIVLFTMLGVLSAFFAVCQLYFNQDIKTLISSMIISILLVYILKNDGKKYD